MYRERLSVPWWWWLLGMGLASTFVIAVWAILGDVWGLGALIVAIAMVAWALLQWSRATITVDEVGLQAAGSRIEGEWLDRVEVLDARAAKDAAAAAGRGGDHLVLRPWLSRAVRVWLDDPHDPHPSWIIATAHPARLAAAVEELMSRRAAAVPSARAGHHTPRGRATGP